MLQVTIKLENGDVLKLMTPHSETGEHLANFSE